MQKDELAVGMDEMSEGAPPDPDLAAAEGADDEGLTAEAAEALDAAGHAPDEGGEAEGEADLSDDDAQALIDAEWRRRNPEKAAALDRLEQSRQAEAAEEEPDEAEGVDEAEAPPAPAEEEPDEELARAEAHLALRRQQAMIGQALTQRQQAAQAAQERCMTHIQERMAQGMDESEAIREATRSPLYQQDYQAWQAAQAEMTRVQGIEQQFRDVQSELQVLPEAFRAHGNLYTDLSMRGYIKPEMNLAQRRAVMQTALKAQGKTWGGKTATPARRAPATGKTPAGKPSNRAQLEKLGIRVNKGSGKPSAKPAGPGGLKFESKHPAAQRALQRPWNA